VCVGRVEKSKEREGGREGGGRGGDGGDGGDGDRQTDRQGRVKC